MTRMRVKTLKYLRTREAYVFDSSRIINTCVYVCVCLFYISVVSKYLNMLGI